jgi:hypothetical protein
VRKHHRRARDYRKRDRDRYVNQYQREQSDEHEEYNHQADTGASFMA